MADISLRDYLAKLNTLLEREASSEAIHHARHILQYFPKNVAAYRALGLALLATGSMNEAVDVFRRVLSVYPDDFIAHLNLGHAYTRARRPNEALWHYERAFERDPNNQTLMENLRRLYREHRQVEHAKIQLTAGAVARQYNRNGLYAQAIETLKQALARTPERADLLLLLANVLWDSNRPVEAGEIALEVLRKLPDSADANRILAELWLREDRPSDAQRYLSRIEAVDPYLAASIARGGQQVAKEMFRLDELDYQRVAQRAVTQQNPDWLTALGGDDPFGAGSAADEGLLDFQDSSDDALITEPPDDWLTSLEGLEEEAGSETKMVSRDAVLGKPPMSDDDFEALFGAAPAEDDLFSFEDSAEAAVPADLPDDWLAGIQIDDSPPASGGSTGFTDFLNQTDFSAPAETTGSTGFTDFLNQTDFSTPEAAPPAPTGGTADDLDWLAMDEFETPTEHEPDPLAWLQGTEIELLDDQPQQSAAPINRGVLSTDEIAAASDHADPLGWLRDSDVEIVHDAPEKRAPTLFETDEPLTLPAVDEADPLAWLRGSDVEVMDDGGAKGLFDTDGLDELEQQHDSADPMAWMQGYNVEVSDQAPPRAARSTVSPAPQPAPVDSGIDWLSDQGLLDEMLNMEQLSDTGEMARIDTGMLQAAEDAASLWEEQPETAAEFAEDDLFGDTGMAVDQPPDAGADDLEELQDWQDAMPENQDNEKSDWFQSSEQGDFDWLDANEDEKPPADTGFDWLNEAGISEQPLSQQPVVAGSAEAEDEATLDWMSELSGEEEVEQPAAQSANFDWLDETEEDAAEAMTGNMPDWLANVGPTEQASPAPTPASSTSLDWLDAPADANQETPMLASAPDWLADVGPTEQSSAAFGDQMDEEQTSEPVSLFAETDDWLNSLDAVETEQPATAAESEFPAMSGGTDDWLSGFDAEEQEEAEAEPAAELDWLSAYGTAETAQAEQETPLEAVGFSTTDDWLSSLDAEQSTVELESEEDEYETAPVGEWLGSLEDETEEDQDQPAVAASESWLSELNVEAETEAQADQAPQFATSMGTDWLSSLEDDEQATDAQPESPLFATGNTDWLNALDQEAESPDEERLAEQPLFASGDDWLSAPDDNEAEEEFAPAEAAFASSEDWLSDLRAADDEDEEAEVEPLAAADADWLTGITVGEAAPDTDDWLSKFEDRPAVGQPDWLAQLDGEDETAEPEEAQPPVTSVAPVGDDSWMSDFGIEADQTAESEVQPAASGVMPDWLSALQSEEEPLADADDWLEEEEDEVEFAAVLPANEDWLSGIGTQGEELEDDLLPEETGAQYDWLDELNDKPAATPVPSVQAFNAGDDRVEYSDEYEEELEMTGASNAPDWLNAMVPGLDVDYQAPEDAPIEQEYLERASAYRARSVTAAPTTRDFDWVNDIVQAETEIHPADADRVPVSAATPRRRFTFSRLPAWLRGNDTAVSAVSAPVRAAAPVFDDDLPNWLSEADELMDDTTEVDDADLPDWLK